ncbi:leucine-rich PPR motif-containing protein, mitochondrial-like isoform X2 [Rhynchophorus ferrugineus]|uniref:leucine-rich PPR motif-containing protein, mitochondrial-like isoform X2 n=1 Tax=Rhynchophorus ferrugineus TaxID=354439 RepID=UPI003FCECA2A
MFYNNNFRNILNKLLSSKQTYSLTKISIPQCSKSISHQKDVTRTKFTLKDLIHHITMGKEFYLKQLTSIFHTIDFTKLTSDEALLLLKCCGADVPDSSCETRHSICQNLFNGLKNANNLNIDLYNCYIRICNENNTHINYNEFLSTLKCLPDQETYKLLIENSCQLGKAEDAFIILDIMKKQNLPIDIEIFNNLALANSIHGGLKLSEIILNIMKSAQIDPNNKTKIAILRGLIKRGDLKDFTIASELYNFEFTGDEFLLLLKELGLMGNEDWLSLIQNNFKHILVTQEMEMKIENVCIHLIHMQMPVSAMKIYEKFIQPIPAKLYGYKLLKEMLHCKIDTDIIIPMAQKLEKSGLSEYLLEALTQVTLKLQYTEAAWALINALNIKRPHYFWPLFIHYGNITKENGVFYVLNKMKQYNLKADEETLENYIYPFCNLSNLRLLIQKMQNAGYSVREALSPLMVNALKRNDLKEALMLYLILGNSYKVTISGNTIPTLLSKCWIDTKQLLSVVNILKKYCECNKNCTDAVSYFLNGCLKKCKSQKDYQEFIKLVQMLKENKLTISLQSAGYLQHLIQSCQTNLENSLFSSINTIVDFNQQFNDDIQLPHPKDMDTDSLECHLIELESKNMETRGVLRKLMLQHAQKGNLQRVKEILTKLTELGYEISFGMKSVIMHNLILGGHVQEAFQLYSEITTTSSYKLDDFKIIDLATLLLKNNRFDEAFHILKTSFLNRKSYRNTKLIERNCWELLRACKDADQIRKMFNLLLENKLCKPTNVILGPIIRCHLNSSDVKRVTETYIEFANKYACTPLQLEILKFILNNGDSTSLQDVLQATEQVHGIGPARVGLIAALAENNQKNKLRSVLGNLTVPIKKLLERRCERWVKESKLEPLLCLAEAFDGLPELIISRNYIYMCIVDVYRLKNDHLGALNFYNNLPEETYRTPSLKNKVNNINSTSTSQNS